VKNRFQNCLSNFNLQRYNVEAAVLARTEALLEEQQHRVMGAVAEVGRGTRSRECS
jgi:hypothetical protein